MDKNSHSVTSMTMIVKFVTLHFKSPTETVNGNENENKIIITTPQAYHPLSVWSHISTIFKFLSTIELLL